MPGGILFFCVSDVLASLLNDEVSILLSQLAIQGVASQGAFHSWQFICGDVPGVILAVMPILKFLMPSRGMRAELTPLHGGDGVDLLQ